MTDQNLQAIVHPTEFSDAGFDAFAHALRIGIAARGSLLLLHIAGENDGDSWDDFPQVRKTLCQWRMIEDGLPQSAVATQLGTRITKAYVEAHDPLEGVVSHLSTHSCDLLVLMTHARTTLRRALHASIAEGAARALRVPALILREGQRGFIDRNSGLISLKRVLMPVDATPSPISAWSLLADFMRLLNPACEIRLLHVGAGLPPLGSNLPPVEVVRGPVVQTIVTFADKIEADLIAMPTAGRRGFLDALQGSTTERVIHEARQPVLAIPAQDGEW